MPASLARKSTPLLMNNTSWMYGKKPIPVLIHPPNQHKWLMMTFPRALKVIIPTIMMTLLNLILPTAYADEPGPACRQRHLTTITLQETGYYLTSVAQIHGRSLSMIIDTGSEGSLLTPEAISQLHLTPNAEEATIISGADGRGHVVPTIELASLTLGHVTFHQPIMPLGALPAFPAIQPPVLGLIGMDLLGHYDIDLDLPHHKLSLWEIQTHSMLCQQPPFWPYQSQRLTAGRVRGRFFIPFTLDGQHGVALIDSGARSHIISKEFVYKLGITKDDLAQDPGGVSAGIGDKEHRYHWHRFGRLTLGGQTQLHPVLTVTSLHEQADMLLGADWLMHHHLWLSAGAEGAVFVKTTPETKPAQKK
ncbi:retroviral-like aspartic protease family protein [Bombella pollinis]|uniref:Retroviral-like aspartic protease family protein n=1 Tax=Bombella pollinis TaxID=2967337 RepID=A0ABT3WMV7_9PROT|nr:retroviral-like aspartic protease family protein [Bombella pollinis]MCX5618973.1 retroviral-like aspartic protease family protein [Bombella pollinis]